ncbi:MAG TPA: diguanylate cyclase [Candidatus Desulfobacillus sp.]|nr:diguanylate cyclase [Candidatus Desulfobacillus sp.]
MLDALKGMTVSLRFRLVAAACFVLVLVLWVQVGNSVRILDEALLARESQHLADMKRLYGVVLAEPLARQDQPRLDELLRQLVAQDGLRYLVLRDAGGRVVAAQGWDPAQPLPQPLADFASLPRDAAVFDGVVALRHEGRGVGSARFGIDTRFLRQAGDRLLWQSIAIGWVAFLITVVLLWLLGYWLTRNLRILQRAAAALESGEGAVHLPSGGKDEIGTLMRAFNRMSQALDERIDALKKSEARFHAIADYTYGVEAWFNPRGRLIWINRSVERVTGHTPLECLLAGDLVALLVHEDDRRQVLEFALGALRGSSGDNFELRLKRKDGGHVWALLNWLPIHGADGEYLGLRVSAGEIQSRKEAELKLLETVDELRRTQELKDYYLTRSNEVRSRLEALLDVMRVGVLFIDRNHRIYYLNNACREVWKVPPGENLEGQSADTLIERTAALRRDDADYRRHVAEVLAGMDVSDAYEFALNDGRVITDISALVPGEKPGQVIGRVWIYEDVTRQKQLEEQLIRLAERDPLTNLYNRRRFHEEIERVIADASRRKSQAGLLAIDLDGFKPVNDAFGHQAGDTVLVRLAEEVGHIVRRNEIFFRIGGDEFAILAPDADEEEMIGLARRVSGKIADMTFDFGGRLVQLTASLGIALYPRHASTSEEIVARADAAMYRAKAAGKNRWAICDDERPR